SATGRIPYSARPTDVPMMPASASGVSTTRSAPKRSISPSVARKTPPLRPTSSPSTRTRSSSASATPSASLMASTRVRLGMRLLLVAGRLHVRPQLAALGLQDGRRRAVDVVEYGFGRRHRLGQRGGDDAGHALAHLLLQRLLAYAVPLPLALQVGAQADERVAFALPERQLVGWAVARGVVGRGVRADAVRQGLDQGGTSTGARALQRSVHLAIHRQHVVAVHQQPRDA